MAGAVRNLLQRGGGGRGAAGGGSTWQSPINTLRSEIATADAIQRAVNSGADPRYTRMAAGVGVTTVFANAQNNQAVSMTESCSCVSALLLGG